VEGVGGEGGKLVPDSTFWGLDDEEGDVGEVDKLATDSTSWASDIVLGDVARVNLPRTLAAGGGVGLDWEEVEMHPVRSMGGELTGDCESMFVTVESFDTLGLLRMLLRWTGLVLASPSNCATS